MRIGNGEFWLGDCLERMRDIPDGSVDMILCDLPYGTTACKWDSVIPFEPLWERYWRVCKPNAAVVLTAAQPFTSALVMSQVDRFKHCWDWDKVRPAGHLAAKKRPMQQTEQICVFGRGSMQYNPRMTARDKNVKGKEGMLVLDNCAGSGTTAIAAERTGRRWLCIEREPSYHYPAVGRVWSEVSGS